MQDPGGTSYESSRGIGCASRRALWGWNCAGAVRLAFFALISTIGSLLTATDACVAFDALRDLALNKVFLFLPLPFFFFGRPPLFLFSLGCWSIVLHMKRFMRHDVYLRYPALHALANFQHMMACRKIFSRPGRGVSLTLPVFPLSRIWNLDLKLSQCLEHILIQVFIK